MRASMKELSRILARLRADVTPASLATLVKVEGSSYRRAGARLLWQIGGEKNGSISGGCLEEDVIAHSQAVFDTGRTRTIVYDTTGENDLVWGTGLGCHGVVSVLVERIAGVPPALDFVERAWAQRRSAVLATVFNTEGSTFDSGPLFALSTSGENWKRTPDVANAIIAGAARCLHTAHSQTEPLRASPGSPEIFFEFLPPPPVLVIFGAGDDAQPLAHLATELGWLVTIVDPRPAYATRARFPTATDVLVAPSADTVSRVQVDARTLAVVMTHYYVHDLPILRDLLPKPLPYVGLIGPKKRTEKILADLTRDGLTITPEMRERLHAPVGLDLGGATPEAVALSILAEMQAMLARRDARPLRERTKPIHRE